ncbi:MAG TPA: hypothetical protein VJP80_00350 [Candidatus Saccharimonadales bacterium]|nr:hypothetical protein [Candidatus Saccharimonadales bacterium]
MGYHTNQWVNKGFGLRDRDFTPVPVRVTCWKITGAWSHQHNVKIGFRADKSNGENQCLYLSESEADDVAAIVVSCMSKQGWEKLLHSLLCNLSDTKLLRVLAADLRERVKLPKRR